MARRLFTSESVTEGHPDKICDQISDAIVDAVLAQDPKGRVAAETLVKTDFALIAGEISTTAKAYAQIIRQPPAGLPRWSALTEGRKAETQTGSTSAGNFCPHGKSDEGIVPAQGFVPPVESELLQQPSS